jgi:YidC/Oxa1 family membrane protein insertase
MEKRLLLAIVLSFLILVLWQVVFVKKQLPPEPTPEIVAETEKKLERILPEEESPPSAALEPLDKEEIRPLSEESEEEIRIDTSLYQAVWSNRGAVLKSWRLKAYKDATGEYLELISVLSDEIKKYPFHLDTGEPEFDRLINSALFTFSSHSLELGEGQRGEIHFEYADERGTRVQKIFSFVEGTYDFDVHIQVWKNGQEIDPRILWGPGFSNIPPEEQRKRFGGAPGIAVYSGDKVYRHEERKFKPEQNFYNFVSWAAYEDNYFAALFLTSPRKTSAAFLRDEEQTPAFFLSADYVQKAYIGPKDLEFLSQFGYGTKKLIKFGFFGWIAEILLRAIKTIHGLIPNWGFSIIILTILIKIIFFPLTYSSTRSMAKMQELQPKMKAIRAKYKKAKKDIAQRRKMNEEIMKLYKEHGINPAGGCLPILIQLPIFWGFFRMLVVSIEFRQSPFILWIRDLSLKDPFYVTPILMGITQFISQKMTPTSADPTQQRMMLIMPVVMTIFFMNFQSGLVLYWLTNNVLQIGQQYIMNRLIHKKKRELHGKKRKR